MSTLKHLLEHNLTLLQNFSSLHNFSSENVAFLTSVAKWKNSLPRAAQDYTTLMDGNVQQLVQEHFHRALCIYVKFISVWYAKFLLNISSQDLKALVNIFKAPAQLLYGDGHKVDPAIPFTTPDSNLEPPVSPAASEMAILKTASSINGRAQYWSVIPQTLSDTVFNSAEDSIKYLILTNMWPKFVQSSGLFAHLLAAE
jgi:hypothetical protein